MLDSLMGNGLQRILAELERRVFELEELLVLLDQSILRFDENADKVFLGQRLQRRDDGNASDKLGNHSELVQVLGQHLLKQSSLVRLLAFRQLGIEPDGRLSNALGNNVGQTNEGTAQDEQDVRRIYVDELLLGMLAPALRGHRCFRTFDYLEQRLLDTLA